MTFTLAILPQDFPTLLTSQVLVAIFLAILFLQSGLDKVFDWKGNKSWLDGHFAKSPLKGQVGLLLGVVTAAEVAAGLASLLGAVWLIFMKDASLAWIGAALSALSLIMLFFGQRMAKDYAGAAVLVPYFILSVGGMLLFAM